jgi:two-component system sensor kinase FixL
MRRKPVADTLAPSSCCPQAEWAEAADDSVYVVGRDLRLTYVNAAAAATMRHPKADLVGRSILDLFPPELSSPQRSNLRKLFRTGQPVYTERHYPTMGGLWLSARLVPLKDASGRIYAAMGISRDISERRRLETAVLEAADSLRRRLGCDLHDGLAQRLFGVGFMAAALERDLAARQLPEAARAGEIAAMLRDAVQATRDIAYGLSPVSELDDGLAAALERLAAETERIYGTVCTFTRRGPPLRRAHRACGDLFLVAQEAVTNAVRHGQARRIGIELAIATRRGTLTVRDDGRGLPRGAAHGRGLGLRIMRYRAEGLGGALTLESQRGAGTLVRCVFPNADPHAEAESAASGRSRPVAPPRRERGLKRRGRKG